MEKQIKNVEVEFGFDWMYRVEISKLKADLEALEKLGATHIEIESEMNWDSPSTSFTAYCSRLETDEEYKERIDNNKRREEEIKTRELQQLEKLKQKYGIK